MAEYTKIVELQDEVQAQRFDLMLTEHGIPHIMRSYHDAAFDGVFQALKGWGHVEAPEPYREEVMDLFAELNRPAPYADNDDDDKPDEPSAGTEFG